MISKLACLVLFILIISACANKKTPQQKQQILAIREMSELASVEYVVTKIIKATDNKTWFKLGERKILISCRATLTAGIDLSKITEKNIETDKKNITLILPRAKLLSLNIKPEDVKTEYEGVSAFRSAFTSAERDALASQGEKHILNSVDSLGILQTAEINASLILNNFLRRLGYEKINIHFDAPPPRSLQ